MMKRTIIKNEKGLLSIEACVSVTVFMLFMLFLYSFFVVFEVRNTMAHALLSTANSMSIDAIRNTEVGDANSLVKPVYHIIYGVLEEFTSGFTDKDRWYENWEPATGGISDKFKDAITERFLAYLASGDDEIDELTLNVIPEFCKKKGYEKVLLVGNKRSVSSTYTYVQVESVLIDGLMAIQRYFHPFRNVFFNNSKGYDDGDYYNFDGEYGIDKTYLIKQVVFDMFSCFQGYRPGEPAFP